MDSSGYKSIGDYGIIGNMHSSALVGIDGSIDWCCLPRFDSPSVFAAILDSKRGGRFQITPRVPFESSQAYIPDTNALRTTFRTGTGAVTVTDFMPCYQTAWHRVTRTNEIHRIVQCQEGQVDLEVTFEPKLNYARGNTLITISKYGATASQDEEKITLSSSIPLVEHKQAAIA